MAIVGAAVMVGWRVCGFFSLSLSLFFSFFFVLFK